MSKKKSRPEDRDATLIGTDAEQPTLVTPGDHATDPPSQTVTTDEFQTSPDPVVGKKKKKKKDKAPEPDLVGSNKAVETMYRNTYRAELDTIALAATKANIMISLNGFIISALMISGAFIFASSPAFLLPAGVFMFTAAVLSLIHI